ncbi:MAG: hypothetical protein AAFQ51_10605 [Pseudomonadota bacterium]
MATFDPDQVTETDSLERRLLAARLRREKLMGPEAVKPSPIPRPVLRPTEDAAPVETLHSPDTPAEPEAQPAQAPPKPTAHQTHIFKGTMPEQLEPVAQMIRRRRRGKIKRALPAAILGAAGAMVLGTSLAALNTANRNAQPWHVGNSSPPPLIMPSLPSDLPSTYIRYDSQPQVNLDIERPAASDPAEAL